ncbi:hypothetical protein HGM15179_003761 [Zosterops borbonicus]|uniref:Ig-like domain-containing protein n=1 Tax=Zosterops borbonicus TaxID=364589 RepID=A0A8K1LR77_9PASS|nr:hypothetical protein HGM15179_003761 [Zosterops borbonicus]
MIWNGTLQIQRLEKEDSGNYMVTVYQRDGKLKAEENIMFLVQDPVPQPILTGDCVNKSVSVKCEAKHKAKDEAKEKAKDEAFMIELIQPNGKKIQRNATVLEWRAWNSGMFRCVAKNQVSEKMAEKLMVSAVEAAEIQWCKLMNRHEARSNVQQMYCASFVVSSGWLPQRSDTSATSSSIPLFMPLSQPHGSRLDVTVDTVKHMC